MTIKILTLFPEMFTPLFSGVIGKAVEKSVISIEVTDIRKYSKDKHFKCDDTPFGGGQGMVMTAQPIYDAIEAVDPDREFLRIYMSPKGEKLNHSNAKNLADSFDKILILCGRYEGVDQRVLDLCIDTEISVGDYVLTGGELAAMITVDALLRFVPGVLGSAESAGDDSFSSGLLEYPQYTRPYDFMGEKVPEVLMSGHHENIKKWRLEQAKQITKQRRPDLIEE